VSARSRFYLVSSTSVFFLSRLIPASHFFEFTGVKSPKTKWRFTKTGEDWFCFAGLWRPMPEGAREAFTILTTEPRPDLAPIHNRQVVVLDRADWLS
jgi:putative SOS response-associated peptidase YedK